VRDWQWTEAVASTPEIHTVCVRLYRRGVWRLRGRHLAHLGILLAGAGVAWLATRLLPANASGWAGHVVALATGCAGGWLLSRLVVPYVDLTPLFHLDRGSLPFWLQHQPRCTPWTFRSVVRQHGAGAFVPQDTPALRTLLGAIDDRAIGTWLIPTLHCELLYEARLRAWLHDHTDGCEMLALRLADLPQCQTLDDLADTVRRLHRRGPREAVHGGP
jgi:hypothetical protein